MPTDRTCSRGHFVPATDTRCLTCKRALALRYYHEGRRTPKPTPRRKKTPEPLTKERHREVRQTFEMTYVLIRSKMVRWAAAITHNWHDAEDATQDALLHIMTQLDLGRTDHNFEAHAYQAVRNEVSKIRQRDWVQDAEGIRIPRWVALPPESELPYVEQELDNL